MDPNSFVAGLFALICLTEKSKGIQHEKKAVAAFQGKFYDVPSWYVDIKNAPNKIIVQCDSYEHGQEIIERIKTSKEGEVLYF